MSAIFEIRPVKARRTGLGKAATARRNQRCYVVLIDGGNHEILSTTEVFEDKASAYVNIAAQREATPDALVRDATVKT